MEGCCKPYKIWLGNVYADIIDHMKGFDYKDHWSKLCKQGFPNSQARISKKFINSNINKWLTLEMKFIWSTNIDPKRRCPSAFSWGKSLNRGILLSSRDQRTAILPVLVRTSPIFYLLNFLFVWRGILCSVEWFRVKWVIFRAFAPVWIRLETNPWNSSTIIEINTLLNVLIKHQILMVPSWIFQFFK